MELVPLLLLLSPPFAAANIGQLLDGLELLGNLFGQTPSASPPQQPLSLGGGVPLSRGPGFLRPAPTEPAGSELTRLAATGISTLLNSPHLQSGVGQLLGLSSPPPPPLPPYPSQRVGHLRQRPLHSGPGLLESLKIVRPAEVVQVQSHPERGGGASESLLDLLSPSKQGEIQSKLIDSVGQSSGLALPKLANFPLFNDNFGIKKQKGCIPFFSEVVRLLWADCQTKADSLTWNAWGRQIQNALKGGTLDLVGAAQETCRLQADRGSCRRLSERIQTCDILGSLQTLTDIQNAKKRCNDLRAFSALPTGPNAAENLIGQVVQSVGSELAGGFLRHVLG